VVALYPWLENGRVSEAWHGLPRHAYTHRPYEFGHLPVRARERDGGDGEFGRDEHSNGQGECPKPNRAYARVFTCNEHTHPRSTRHVRREGRDTSDTTRPNIAACSKQRSATNQCLGFRFSSRSNGQLPLPLQSEQLWGLLVFVWMSLSAGRSDSVGTIRLHL
jgi:hypothetical protein